MDQQFFSAIGRLVLLPKKEINKLTGRDHEYISGIGGIPLVSGLFERGQLYPSVIVL